ncbi:hypothetical protein BDV18DRAFT_161764 [Aspergillus unguis]
MLLKYILFLAFLTPHVYASKLAGRYYVVYLWFAYRLDISANGASDARIAPGCAGSASAASCTFDEFVRYLQRNNARIDSGYETSIGNRQFFDPVEGAQELEKFTVKGNPYVANVDPAKIFKTGTFTVDNPQLGDIIDKVTNVIQDARTTLGDAIPGGRMDFVEKALAAQHEARIAENAPELTELLNDWLENEKGSSTKVETREMTAFDGSKFTDVDLAKTVAKDSSFADYWLEFHQDWLPKQKRTKKTIQGRWKQSLFELSTYAALIFVLM